MLLPQCKVIKLASCMNYTVRNGVNWSARKHSSSHCRVSFLGSNFLSATLCNMATAVAMA